MCVRSLHRTISGTNRVPVVGYVLWNDPVALLDWSCGLVMLIGFNSEGDLSGRCQTTSFVKPYYSKQRHSNHPRFFHFIVYPVIYTLIIHRKKKLLFYTTIYAPELYWKIAAVIAE